MCNSLAINELSTAILELIDMADQKGSGYDKINCDRVIAVALRAVQELSKPMVCFHMDHSITISDF